MILVSYLPATAIWVRVSSGSFRGLDVTGLVSLKTHLYCNVCAVLQCIDSVVSSNVRNRYQGDFRRGGAVAFVLCV